MSKLTVGIILIIAGFIYAQDQPAVPDSNDSDQPSSDIEAQPAPDNSELEQLKKSVSELEVIGKAQKQEIQGLQQKLATIEKKLAEETQKPEVKEKEEPKAKEEPKGAGKLQPDVSVTGDFYIKSNFASPPSDGPDRSGAFIRVGRVDLNTQMAPSLKNSLVLDLNSDGLELNEMFFTWNGIDPSLTLRVGKFLQNFGAINRRHISSMDQVDNPLATDVMLGGKINQTGIGLSWVMPPMWATRNEIIVEGTNGQNPHLFSGEAFDIIPCGLARLINAYDLEENFSLDIGFSGMAGQNNVFHDDTGANEYRKPTFVGGGDLTLHLGPSENAKYRSILWRTEVYYVASEQQDNNYIDGYGGYSYIESRMCKYSHLGLRFDYTQPFEWDNSEKNTWQLVPYATFKFPGVQVRLQYNFKNGSEMDSADHIAYLQLVWSPGSE